MEDTGCQGDLPKKIMKGPEPRLWMIAQSFSFSTLKNAQTQATIIMMNAMSQSV